MGFRNLRAPRRRGKATESQDNVPIKTVSTCPGHHAIGPTRVHPLPSLGKATLRSPPNL